MPQPLPPHTHCLNCDDPIPEDQDFCSEKCKDSYQERIKKERRRMMYFYIVAIVAIIGIGLISSIA
ncbi:MAG: DUF2116 family Zn-ribbon domain-containing protein [Methanomassiliicoccales archaeon]|jgi:predicted nucleic acid-binding Zn ribbon protein|nr:DUF2116 family Zn-ribbon domain-containing protein [Methanomassiliicoccales archaeon]